jgi:DNA topoisomerase VI subunit A
VSQHLQSILDNVALSLELDIPATIQLRTRHNAQMTTLKDLPGHRHQRFRIPSAFTFGDVGCIIRVMEIIVETLVKDIIITKRLPCWRSEVECRDIYYRDPTLFKSQGTVDRIVNSLAYTLLIPRTCLHVVPSIAMVRYLTR